MAKLCCAVILAAGWTLALATPNPLTDEEKKANCQNITVENQGTNSKVVEDPDNPCYYTCTYQDSDGFSLEKEVNAPDGIDCGESKKCDDGNCLDKRAIDMCQAKMPDYTQISDDGNCFIECSKGDKVNYVLAPVDYPCQPVQTCASKGACDEKGRCTPVRDEVTANAKDFPSANEVRAYMDCATRYTNGTAQYKKKKLQLTSASSDGDSCSYTCVFTNTTDKSLVQEDYCFAELTDCTNTTDPNAEENVCVFGFCQSKALYDKCMAEGYDPQMMGTNDCVTLYCNSAEVNYAPLAETCQYQNTTGICDGKGNCGPPIELK